MQPNRPPRGELSDSELAAILESEVLPLWHPARTALEGVDLEGGREDLRQRQDELVRYALELEEEWTNTALLLRVLEEFYCFPSAEFGHIGPMI